MLAMQFGLLLVVVCKMLGQASPIFYLYGEEEGDNILFKNDDGFEGPISIATRVPFFNKSFGELFVNTNGAVSFENGVSAFTPDPFPLASGDYLIAAFWGDVDTTINNGSIYYRESTDENLLIKITDDILETYASRGLYIFKATWAYIVTWENVTHYGGNTTSLVNSFQLVIVTDGTFAFTVFNYHSITWTYGTASDGIDAQVGFNAGDGINYFSVPGSRAPDIADVEETTNVGIPGRWIFRIDEAKIDDGKCTSEGECAVNEELTETGCQEIAPALNDCPLLVGPTVVDRQYVYFYCNLSHNYTNSDEVAFEVTFLFNGEPVENVDTVTIADGSVALHEKFLHGNLDKWISCSVVSYFTQTPEKKSAPYSSNSYFAGIMPSDYELIIHEGDDLPAKVYLQSSLPITCLTPPSDEQQNCHTEFNIISTGDLLVYQELQGGADIISCRYRFDENHWRLEENMAYSVENQLQVTTVKGPFLDPPKVDSISFGTGQSFCEKQDENGTYYLPFWCGYSPPSITVYIYDDISAMCVSNGDPRITTFDNRNYNVYSIGQFVLARSSSPTHFEVHVRHKHCDRSVVACVCGIAVREGNDVLSLDMCTSDLKALHRTVSSDQQLAKGAEITSNGANSYSIRTPSGAYVNVDVFYWGMNVYLKVLGQYLNKMEGLCGTFDNNPNNDFKLQGSDDFINKNDPIALNGFVQSWRISDGNSFFEKNPERTEPTNPNRCKCQAEHILCDITLNNEQFLLIVPTGISIITNFILPPLQRKKRGVSLQLETDNVEMEYNPFDFDYATNSSNNLIFEWPTESGITEIQAWNHCNASLVESVVYQTCTNYTSDSHLNEVILKCVEDIKVTGSYDWAKDKITELKEDCLNSIVQTNHSMNLNATSNGVAEAVLQAVQDIISNICPNQCNDKGQCLNTVCVCHEGFEGVDCSVDSSLLPIITSLNNGGLCDIQERPCNTISMKVENIINTETLYCRIQVAEAEDIFFTNGSYQGLHRLICPLPAPQILLAESNLLTYSLSITKNGNEYGTPKIMKVFDGNCIECDDMLECRILDSRCSIGGKCIDSAVEHPNNTCYICDPTQKQNQWSISPENQTPKMNGSFHYVKLMNEQAIITLQAFDPEGDSVTFLTDVSLGDSVYLLPNGTLTWKEDSNHNITVPIIMQDVCGQNSTEVITLTIIDCPCLGNRLCNTGNLNGSGLYDCTCPAGFTNELCLTNIDDCVDIKCNQGTCIDGINMYTCSCDEGYTDIHCDTEINYCLSSPCASGTCLNENKGYICLCEDNFTGDNCEVDLRFSVWSQWSDYNSCTKSCDYGRQVRHRSCLLFGTCTGISEETRLCSTQNCPELDEEANIGSQAVIDGTDIEKFLHEEQSMFLIWAERLNEYCGDMTATCCGSMIGTSDFVGSKQFGIFQSQHFRVASGFPKVTDNQIIIKIIVEITRQSVSDVCLDRSKRETDNIFVSRDIMDEVIVSSADRIQYELGITVSLYEPSGDDGSTGLTTIYIAVGITFLFGVVIVVTAICLLKRKRNSFQSDIYQGHPKRSMRRISSVGNNLSLGVRERLPRSYRAPATVYGRGGLVY